MGITNTMPEKTLFQDIPIANSVEPDQITRDFMQVASDYWQANSQYINDIQSLLKEKDTVANIDDPTKSNKRTNSTILHTGIHKMVELMQKPAFQLFAAEASENTRATMQGLAEDILYNAGWDRVLTNKKSGAQRFMLETGDAIIGYDSNPQGRFPLQYFREETNRFFVNGDAIEMRNPGSEREVRKRIIIKEYQWEQAVAAHPELEGNATLGALPVWECDNEFRFNELQEALIQARRIQIAYCVDIDYKAKDGKRGLYCIIAGGNQFKFGEKEGNDYPNKDKFGNPVIPEGHLICLPRSDGFLNFGFLHLLYKIGVIHSKLLNMGITYTLANTNPVRVIATNLSETEVANRMSRALRDGAEGKLPIMVAADGKEFGGVSTTSAPAVINEANAVLDLLEKQLAQMGVNINNVMTDSTKTLGALQLEVASSSAIIKYIQESNAAEYGFLIEQGLESVASRQADDSDIQLVSSVKIRKQDGTQEDVLGVPERNEGGSVTRDNMGRIKVFRSFSLQDFKDLWNAYEWKVIVSGGVVNNPVLEDAIDRSVQAAFPGSKAAAKAAASMYQRHARNYTEDDFAAPPQVNQPTQLPDGGMNMPV